MKRELFGTLPMLVCFGLWGLGVWGIRAWLGADPWIDRGLLLCGGVAFIAGCHWTRKVMESDE